MKDQLLSIAGYIESLEQRIAAQEAAMAVMNTRLGDLQMQLDALRKKMNGLPVQQAATEDEPEVEVELIVQDDEQDAETADEPMVVQEETHSEVSAMVEETEAEEPVVEETKPQEKQVAPAPTQQTTLFGAPVRDIRQAISIGDRFLFQRELFDGNGETMQKLLDRLNNCANLNEAMDIIATQQWDTNSPTYELFINVLRRRF